MCIRKWEDEALDMKADIHNFMGEQHNRLVSVSVFYESFPKRWWKIFLCYLTLE